MRRRRCGRRGRWRGSGAHIATHLTLHILPVLGDCPLGQLAERPSMIRQWLAGLKLSRLSAGQVFITLSAILAAAAEDGLIQRNPCKVASVRPAAPPRRKVVPWTTPQVLATRAALPRPWQAIADCGAGLGLRQGEAFGLRPGAVDFLRRTVHVNRQVLRVNGRLWLAAPKEGRDRDVPLPGTVSLAVAEHIRLYPRSR